MTFLDFLGEHSPATFAARMAAVTPADVRRVLAAERLSVEQAPVLFSPAAQGELEAMARRARQITRARFGRTMTLYAPLYLANHCINGCTYCGFAAKRDIARRALSLEQAVAEAEVLLAQGVRHVLLVTGEAPKSYGLDDLCAVVRALRPRCGGISIEIFPCDQAGYERLAEAGVDGLVLYQEVYDRALYAPLHPHGPKRDWEKRLLAIEAGGRAGFRSLGIGFLLGLAPPREEACLLAYHAAYLTKTFARSRLAVSLPRLRPVAGGAAVAHPVSDRELVQLVAGMRLLFPDAELVLSTREPAALRDAMMTLGVTRMSAGSRTSPGAYADQPIAAETGQFATDDQRSVAEVEAAIAAAGLDPVQKDFDPAFLAPR